MAPQDPESLARRHRVQRLCRELSHLLQTSVEQRQVIDELLTKLEAVTRGPAPRARAAGRSADGLSRG
jgi:Trp operon repressor